MPDRNAGVGATGRQPVPVAASARVEAFSISVGKSAPDPSGPPAIAAAVQNSADGSPSTRTAPGTRSPAAGSGPGAGRPARRRPPSPRRSPGSAPETGGAGRTPSPGAGPTGATCGRRRGTRRTGSRRPGRGRGPGPRRRRRTGGRGDKPSPGRVQRAGTGPRRGLRRRGTAHRSRSSCIAPPPAWRVLPRPRPPGRPGPGRAG